LIFVVLLFIAGVTLQQKNKRLTEVNSKLLLQNDSVLSVNLQLQKELLRVQRGLDSLEQHRYTSR
jgi:hypothetical protein